VVCFGDTAHAREHFPQVWKIRGGMQLTPPNHALLKGKKGAEMKPHPHLGCRMKQFIAKGRGMVLGPKMCMKGDKPFNSFLSHCTLGSVQRDETASRGPASTWEVIPFGMSLQWTMLRVGHGSQVTH